MSSRLVKGLAGLVAGVVMLGTSMITSPRISGAETKKIYHEKIGSITTEAFLHNGDTLEIEIITDNYSDSGKRSEVISHADINLIYLSRLEIKSREIRERGYLTTQNRLVDLKEEEERNKLPKRIFDSLAGIVLGDNSRIEDWIRKIDSFRKSCDSQNNYTDLNHLGNVLRNNRGILTSFDVPKYSEFATMAAVEYVIPFDITKFRGEFPVTVFLRVNRSRLKSDCLRFSFNVTGNPSRGNRLNKVFRYDLNGDGRNDTIHLRENSEGNVRFNVEMSSRTGKFKLIYCKELNETSGECYFFDYYNRHIGTDKLKFPKRGERIGNYNSGIVYVDKGRDGRIEEVLR